MAESKSNRPENIQIGKRSFEFLKIQRDAQSTVYKSADAYLRIGSPDKILADLAFHKQMEEANFPVAKIISEGELNGQVYFVESSLGERHFGQMFAEDIEKTGSISKNSFEEFLNIVKRFAKAQLRTRGKEGNYAEFADGIYLDVLCEELPEQASKIQAIFERMKEKFKALPFVTTHGDFNPNNLYPTGVIDLEDSFRGPFGYDLIGAFIHIDYFPDSTDFEYFAKYRFSNGQKQEYFEFLDRVSVEENLPLLSGFQHEFEFARAVWLLVRMHAQPKLQKFRYDLFTERFLKDA